MSLGDAVLISGKPAPRLPAGPPYDCRELEEWRGAAFWLRPGDARLESLHRGGPATVPAHENLAGAVRGWEEFPEWMDFLDPEAPNHVDKILERAVYLDLWRPWLVPGARVLDLGGATGRFTAWLLDQGCEVELVDPDLRSLWRAVAHSVGRPGRLDVHWSTGESLPPIEPVDVVIACEVLCYCEDPRRVLTNIQEVLRPGGVLLCSVEARWGWAMSTDAAEHSIEAFLADGVVNVPGDRWVQTHTEQSFRELLADFSVLSLVPTHYALSGPFELSGAGLPLEQALELEARLRAHPIARELNRAWAAACKVEERADTVVF